MTPTIYHQRAERIMGLLERCQIAPKYGLTAYERMSHAMRTLNRRVK